MSKILNLDTEYSFGSITFTINNSNEFTNRFDYIKVLEFEDNISELFFINLLKITIDAVANIQDTDREYIEFMDVSGDNIRIKLLHRNISLEFLNNNISICTIFIPYNIKQFTSDILLDYKELTASGKLKKFLNEDSAYMKLINDYYQKLQKAYSDTF